MKKVLEMLFRTVGDKNVMLIIPDPKDDITSQQVAAAMQTIITKNIFATSRGDLRDHVTARIRVTDVTTLA